MSPRTPNAVLLLASVFLPTAGCSGDGISSPAGSGRSSTSGGAPGSAGTAVTSAGAIFGAGGNSAVSAAGSPGSAGLGNGGTVPSGGSIPGGFSGTATAGSVSMGGQPSAGAAGGAAAGGSTSSGGATAAGSGSGGTSSGGKASGGASAGGASSGGTTSGGGTSGTCIPATCGSHKWACWKMPNPAASGLPNPASYTSTTDVVHDNVTCLDWQRNPPTTTYTNTSGIAYCEGLSLGGFDDWRAPTRVEQSSIMDWTRSPATDAAFGSAGAFHKTASNWVLTANQQGAGKGTDFAWAFNMSDGIVSNAYSAATAARIRCVRGNGAGEGFSDPPVTPPNQYTALSADAAQDNYTGLIWQRDGAASGLLAWDAAVTYCANLSLATFDDWRLPSVRELATLVDEWLVAPSINRTMFPNTRYGARSNNWYWASHASRTGSAHWALNYDDGFTGFNAGASGAWNYWTQAYVKCVR